MSQGTCASLGDSLKMPRIRNQRASNLVLKMNISTPTFLTPHPREWCMRLRVRHRRLSREKTYAGSSGSQSLATQLITLIFYERGTNRSMYWVFVWRKSRSKKKELLGLHYFISISEFLWHLTQWYLLKIVVNSACLSPLECSVCHLPDASLSSAKFIVLILTLLLVPPPIPASPDSLRCISR